MRCDRARHKRDQVTDRKRVRACVRVCMVTGSLQSSIGQVGGHVARYYCSFVATVQSSDLHRRCVFVFLCASVCCFTRMPRARAPVCLCDAISTNLMQQSIGCSWWLFYRAPPKTSVRAGSTVRGVFVCAVAVGK